ncbi:MAG: hypothetical protein ACFFD1_14310 [Candidatus Thorarchaeota archaeon]
MKKNKKKRASNKNHKSSVKKIKLSSTEIEKLYREEKKKIYQSSIMLEEERVKAYLRMLDKRKSLLSKKIKSLGMTENSLKKQADEVLKNVANLKNIKLKEKKHLNALSQLNKKIRNIDQQTKNVIVSRREMLNNEKRLFRNSLDYLRRNVSELEYQGMRSVRKIDELLNQKKEMLENTADTLTKDMNNLFKGKNILKEMSISQLKAISKINQKLDDSARKQAQLLKVLEKVKKQDLSQRRSLNYIDNKRRKFLLKLQEIKSKLGVDSREKVKSIRKRKGNGKKAN